MTEPARDPFAAGGNRIRTIGPARVKGLSPVADERCRTDKLDGVIKHRSSRETTMVGRGASLDGRLFLGGPMVRIRFPPAESLQTFGSSRAATATLAHTLSNCCLTTVASAVLLWPFGWGARSKPRLAAMCVWPQSAISAIV